MNIIRQIYLIPSFPLVILLAIIIIINSDITKLSMSAFSGELSEEIEELKKKIYFRAIRCIFSTIIWILIIKYFI